MGYIEELSKICTETTSRCGGILKRSFVVGSPNPAVKCSIFPSFNVNSCTPSFNRFKPSYRTNMTSTTSYFQECNVLIELSYKGYIRQCLFHAMLSQEPYHIRLKKVLGAFVESCLSNYRAFFLNSQANIIYKSWTLDSTAWQNILPQDRIHDAERQVLVYLLENHPEDIEYIVNKIAKRNKSIARNAVEKWLDDAVESEMPSLTASLLELKRKMPCLQTSDSGLIL